MNGQHGQSTTRYELSFLHNASQAFQTNRWILCDKNVSRALLLKFFDAMVTSVVCFAAGHRKLYVGELRQLIVHCRRLLGRMVGSPADINWNRFLARNFAGVPQHGTRIGR